MMDLNGLNIQFLFYHSTVQGVKANLIFLQKGLPTEDVWIYDNRSNIAGITKKDRPLTLAQFEEFEQCYATRKTPTTDLKKKNRSGNGRAQTNIKGLGKGISPMSKTVVNFYINLAMRKNNAKVFARTEGYVNF